MRIIQLKCESDQPCFDQRVHTVAVNVKTTRTGMASREEIRLAPLCSGPSSPGKKLIGQRVRKARVRKPDPGTNSHLIGEEFDAKTKL